MTRVVVHRRVMEQDLKDLRKTDPDTADALVETIRGLVSSSRGGRVLEQPGWRAYLAVPGHGIIVTGVGSGTVRVIGACRLPSLYDRDRLREMAESAGITQEAPGKRQQNRPRDPGVPAPAPRTRVVALDETALPPALPDQPSRSR